MALVKRDVRRREAGMAYVEMIFVLPVLLLLIAALADFSIMIHDWMIANHAAKTAVRAASMFDLDCDANDKHDAGIAAIHDLLDHELMQSSWTEATVSIQHIEFPAHDLCEAGVIVASVPVQYSFHFLRFVPDGVGLAGPPTTLVGAATAMNENDL